MYIFEQEFPWSAPLDKRSWFHLALPSTNFVGILNETTDPFLGHFPGAKNPQHVQPNECRNVRDINGSEADSLGLLLALIDELACYAGGGSGIYTGGVTA